ncbi:MAG: hypothetical protein KatS3mg124_1442 [Porticoccaceae bacterium]|nr:MAG: hypothetical protein KatS3mg124_1442 [Porticoccaceae bacterium]
MALLISIAVAGVLATAPLNPWLPSQLAGRPLVPLGVITPLGGRALLLGGEGPTLLRVHWCPRRGLDRWCFAVRWPGGELAGRVGPRSGGLEVAALWGRGEGGGLNWRGRAEPFALALVDGCLLPRGNWRARLELRPPGVGPLLLEFEGVEGEGRVAGDGTGWVRLTPGRLSGRLELAGVGALPLAGPLPCTGAGA